MGTMQPMNRYELADWIRLLLIPGVGKLSARKLLAAFGLPANIFEQSPAALAALLSPTQVASVLDEPPGYSELLDATWDWLSEDMESRRILTLDDPLYPQRLLETEDPPLLLHALGAPFVWQHNLLNARADRCIAVVGSRNPTPQGASNARQFSQALGQAGWTIVSGMALGVDGAAHEGALEGASPGHLATVAVVGTGLDRVYPKQHRNLAHRIAQQGVLLSEFPLGTGPLAPNFPQRNRIISGLSRGTLVVEAALQSGSLITARLAAEQGRDVFAIPGSIHATQSRGCHALIKQGAKLVESAQDVLDELQLDTRPSDGGSTLGETEPSVPPAAEESALELALGFDPVGLDALQARTGLPTPDLLAQLMTMELQGAVARLPGGLFQRMAQA